MRGKRFISALLAFVLLVVGSNCIPVLADVIDQSTALIQDGIYYIQNKNSGRYLEVLDGSIAENSPIIHNTKDDHELRGLKQIWKVTYLGNGKYSIRPLHRLDMGLSVNNTNVGISTIGTIENIYNVQLSSQWTIESAELGLVLKNNGDSLLTLFGENAAKELLPAVLTSEYNSSLLHCHWEFERISDMPSYVLFYDTWNLRHIYDFSEYVAPDETRSLSQQRLAVGTCPEVYSGEPVEWTTADRFIARVDEQTGAVTGINPGHTTITATIGETSSSYQINVTEFANAVYFIQNKHSNKYMYYTNYDVSNGDSVMQWGFENNESQRWELNHYADGYYLIQATDSYYFLGVEIDDNYNVTTGLYESGNTENILWRITKTPTGAFKIVNKSLENIGMVLGLESASAYDAEQIQQRFYIEDNLYYDEWRLHRYYAPSGWELEYSPQIWNNIHVVRQTNCYAYAFNNQVWPGTNHLWYMQPGQFVGIPISQDIISRDLIIDCVIHDSEALGFRFQPIGEDEPCSAGSYKVALVIDPGNDYHWYRQNSDGTWSHKLATNEVCNTDASGNIIIDPRTADRTYLTADYTDFGGFFEVTPLNNMYIYPNNLNLHESANDIMEIDNNKTALPTIEDMQEIVVGMTYSDVTAKIGLPQRILDADGIVVAYELPDGTSQIIRYVRNNSGELVVEDKQLEALS